MKERRSSAELSAPRAPAQADRGASSMPERHALPTRLRGSDSALIELLMEEPILGVGTLASALRVTATAVRQRLERLMQEGIIARERLGGPAAGDLNGRAAGRTRGRPAYGYRLTEKGRRTGGDNFHDLAIVLWKEIRSIAAPEVRRGLVTRVGTAMAGLYRDEVRGATVAERLDNTVRLLQDRRIACGVEFQPAETPGAPALAILTSHVCPYPDLAESDRGICAAERAMLQDLLDTEVTLADCRLDGDACCRFHIRQTDLTTSPTPPIPAATKRGPPPPASRPERPHD